MFKNINKIITSACVFLSVCVGAPAAKSSFQESVFSPKRDGTYQAEYDYYHFNAYEITQNLCKGSVLGVLNVKRLPFFWYSLRKSLIPGKDMNAMSKTNPRVQALVDSDDYWQALEDCYGPNNLEKIEIFTAQLFAADFVGRAVATVLGVKALKYIRPGVEAGLSKIPLVGKASLFTKGVMMAFDYGPLVAFGVPVTIQIIKTKYRQHKFNENPADALEDTFDENRKQTDDPLIEQFKSSIITMSARLNDPSLSEEEKVRLESKIKELSEVVEEYNNLRGNAS